MDRAKIRHSYKSAAFTLVELLVVISIIALLLAVLMPALNKAREQGKKIVCSSNEKQLAMALIMYTQNVGVLGYVSPASGGYPAIINGASGTTMWWHQILGDQGYFKSLKKGPTELDPIPKSVCKCPGVAKFEPISPYSDVWNTWKGIAYSMNYHLSVSTKDSRKAPAGSGYVRPRKLVTIPQASDVVLLMDDIPMGSPTNAGSWFWQKPLQLRHSGKANIAYVDGHVGSVKKGELPTDQTSRAYIHAWGDPAY